jgi:hypothetical protein
MRAAFLYTSLSMPSSLLKQEGPKPLVLSNLLRQLGIHSRPTAKYEPTMKAKRRPSFKLCLICV